MAGMLLLGLVIRVQSLLTTCSDEEARCSHLCSFARCAFTVELKVVSPTSKCMPIQGWNRQGTQEQFHYCAAVMNGSVIKFAVTGQQDEVQPGSIEWAETAETATQVEKSLWIVLLHIRCSPC